MLSEMCVRDANSRETTRRRARRLVVRSAAAAERGRERGGRAARQALAPFPNRVALRASLLPPLVPRFPLPAHFPPPLRDGYRAMTPLLLSLRLVLMAPLSPHRPCSQRVCYAVPFPDLVRRQDREIARTIANKLLGILTAPQLAGEEVTLPDLASARARARSRVHDDIGYFSHPRPSFLTGHASIAR